MTWVKLSDTFAEDPRLEAAGTDAFVLHVAALCYCNRNLTDGQLSRGAARRLWAIDDLTAAVDALIREGLWAETARGYELLDYLKDQPSAARVQEVRQQKTERQARWRARQDASTSASTNPSTDASRDGLRDAAPPRPAPPRPEGRRGGAPEHSASAPIPAPPGMEAGARIVHRVFGKGTIATRTGTRAEIHFDHAEPRHLPLTALAVLTEDEPAEVTQ